MTVLAISAGVFSGSEVWEQALRFWSLQDGAVRYALLGSVFLGLSCGLLGSFIVVRKMALLGDTLSHAVFPGVALGFLWNMSKDPVAILVGATGMGILGSALVSWIRQTTLIKEDAAMGIVLTGFYGVGVCLMSMIQSLPGGNKAGLDRYFFGQAAALAQEDIVLMGGVAIFSLVLVAVLYKEYVLISFDSAFAHSVGVPARFLHYLLMLLLSFAIVVSLQAVGILLITALLITPAATAYLLTDRLHRLLLIAMGLGVVSGVMGAFISFLENGLPTGPFMVLTGSFFFVLAYGFAPRHGVVLRWLKRARRKQRIQIENTLKAIFHVREGVDFLESGVSLHELEERLNEPLVTVLERVQALERAGIATLAQQSATDHPLQESRRVYLTPQGWERACEIVRNHRLWELYLTHAADYADDHVHEDAELIEHMIGEKTVRALERRLNYPSKDPHGKWIPGVMDMETPERPHERRAR